MVWYYKCIQGFQVLLYPCPALTNTVLSCPCIQNSCAVTKQLRQKALVLVRKMLHKDDRKAEISGQLPDETAEGV